MNARTSSLPDYITNSNQHHHDPYADLGLDNDEPEFRNNSDTVTNTYCTPFLDVLTNNQLKILNGRTLGDIQGKFTCFKWNGKSTVDYFCSSPLIRQHVNYLKVQSMTSYSDHCPVLLSLNFLNSYKFLEPIFDFEAMPSRYKWDSTSHENFVTVLESPEVSTMLDEFMNRPYTYDVNGNNELSSNFTSIIKHIATRSLQVSKKPKKLPHKKWFDLECRKSKTNLNRLACNMSRNIHCTEIRERYFISRNKHTKLIQKKRTDFLSRLNKSIENGHVLDWKKFKQLKQQNDSDPLLDKYDLLSFYEYFTDLYKKVTITNPDIDSEDQNTITLNQNCQQLNCPITPAQLEEALKKLRPGKSTSLDLISNEMLKALNASGKNALLKLFNHCLSTGKYPWHTSVITPIFKSGNRYNPDDYRAIAVGSCLGKLFSSILLNRLLSFKAEHCRDPDEQLGFKKGAQTNDHILTLQTIIEKYTKRQHIKLLTCFVDLKKAFDTVSRDLLLYKLTKLNIRGQFFKVIEDMYNNSLAKIKIDKLLTPNIQINRGTEQGHPLSPDLFKLFIRDLSHLFHTIGDYPYLSDSIVTHLLWADDLVLIALDQVSLQANIDILDRFCSNWGLQVNLKKTKILTFYPTKKRSHNEIFYFNNVAIEQVSSYCYLGIMFHESGTFKLAFNELRKKALRALFGLKNNILKSSLSTKSLFLLFDALIKPILLYGCQITSPFSDITKYLYNSPTERASDCFINKIARDPYEKFHLKFIKWCLSVHSKAANLGCWGDSGRYPLIFEALKLSVDYHERLKKLNDNSLLLAAYTEQVSLNLNWYKHISHISDTFGSGLSIRPSINIRKNLDTLFKTKWYDSMNKSPKLDFYKTLKTEFGYEPYLSVTNQKHRSALTKLRISAHNLFIERGRYARPLIDRASRFCTFCKFNNGSHEIEDESHVLLHCPLYTPIRHKILGPSSSQDIMGFFTNPNNDAENNITACRLASTILDTNDKYTKYYIESQDHHTCTGKCVVM